MKVLSLLQDEDQKLASAIVSSREAIRGLPADPKKFGDPARLNAGVFMNTFTVALAQSLVDGGVLGGAVVCGRR